MLFLAARYANEDHTAAIVDTDGDVGVLIAPTDTPAMWAAMLASGVDVQAYRQYVGPAPDHGHPAVLEQDMGKPIVIA